MLALARPADPVERVEPAQRTSACRSSPPAANVSSRTQGIVSSEARCPGEPGSRSRYARRRGAGRCSTTVTSAPSPCRRSAVARPPSPAPTTTTFTAGGPPERRGAGAPAAHVATRSCAITRADRLAARSACAAIRNGRASPAAIAPSARHLAASTPSRSPPDAMTGRPGAAERDAARNRVHRRRAPDARTPRPRPAAGRAAPRSVPSRSCPRPRRRWRPRPRRPVRGRPRDPCRTRPP